MEVLRGGITGVNTGIPIFVSVLPSFIFDYRMRQPSTVAILSLSSFTAAVDEKAAGSGSKYH